jgi:hypothetical protein
MTTTTAASPLSGAKPLMDAPLDALARIFLALGQHYNTNSNQIMAIQGDLDLERLRGAVRRAVCRYDHVLLRLNGSQGRWLAEEVPVREVHFGGECSLQNEAFRNALMDLSDGHRIDWRHQPATQVFLIRSADRQTCCVYLNSAHAAADAASDCMLMAEISAQYERAHAVQPAPRYAPLPEVAPGWFTWHARLRRWAAAWLDIARANGSRDGGLALPATGRHGYAPQEAKAGFCSSILPASVMADARRAAKAANVSLNTVFATALVRHMAATAGSPKGKHYRLSLAVSLRALLPSKGREAAFGNHIITCTLRQLAGLQSKLLVHTLDASVKALKQARLQVELGRFELALPFMALGAVQPITRRAMGRAQATNVCYSNPGAIPQDYSTFGGPGHTVLGYAGLGCLVSPFDLMFYTTTVNGQTQLDALYRRACFQSIEDELLQPYRGQLDRVIHELLALEAPATRATQELPA